MDILRKNWFPLVIAILIIGLAAFFIFGRSSGPALPVLQEEAPQFELQSTDGEMVSIANTQDKVRLVYFFFAHCPDICLPTNYMLSTVQNKMKDKGIFGDDAIMMSITFDPERDTVEYLQEYMENVEADTSGWYFLRDDDEDKVRSIALEYKIDVIPAGEGDFIHTNVFTLIDGKGQIRKLYFPNNPADFDALGDEIIDDMVKLIKE